MVCGGEGGSAGEDKQKSRKCSHAGKCEKKESWAARNCEFERMTQEFFGTQNSVKITHKNALTTFHFFFLLVKWAHPRIFFLGTSFRGTRGFGLWMKERGCGDDGG